MGETTVSKKTILTNNILRCFFVNIIMFPAVEYMTHYRRKLDGCQVYDIKNNLNKSLTL